MEKNDFYEFIARNKGRIFGVLVGFAVAICILEYGFFKSLFVFACVGIGLYFGGKRENRERFLEMLSKLINDRKD